MDDEILACFLEESTELLADLRALGESLKKVAIPNEEESKRLIEFGQKLNRLIGGAAAMGMAHFSPICRNTSLLAAKCAEIKEMTIRLLIMNLNNVVEALYNCFADVESMKRSGDHIVEIERRIDLCMSAVGLDKPDVKGQSEIDALMASLGK